MSLAYLFEERRSQLAGSGHAAPWILVFDVDSTLMDTGPRNEAILTAAAEAIPELSPWRGRLPPVSRSWNIQEPLQKAGISDMALLGRIKEFWLHRFFTDTWVRYDRPYPGAAACLHDLKSRGFDLIYLTGRHSPGMEAGTRSSFREHGFPVDDATFIFKPSMDDDDLSFKKEACMRIGDRGTVVGTLDNEPANVNFFLSVFPEALTIWMRTITSPSPAKVDDDVLAVAPGIFGQNTAVPLQERHSFEPDRHELK